MNRLNLMASALASLALALCAGAASATTYVGPISGSVGQGGDFTGSLRLDVVDGKAVSGIGTLNIYGLSNASLALITYETPGIILDGGLLGFRGNDGTDFMGLDTTYPIDGAGLLFDVGTSTPEWGQHPLFALWLNDDGSFGSAFTGGVDGTEHWAQMGSAVVSAVAVPEPSTWLLMLAGFGLVGGGLRTARRRRGLALA